MNPKLFQGLLILLLCLGFVAPLPSAHGEVQVGREQLSTYLPLDNEVPGYHPEGPPQLFRGDELFMMIDGGADIYHEYGFAQVLTTRYGQTNGKSFKIEIYEMKDAAAAWGIYTFKSGKEGQTVDLGQGAILADYYLNFWKGNFLVTIVGDDANEETRQALLALAKAVDSHIPQTGKLPMLAATLLRGPDTLESPIYVRGLLGLMQIYVFDTKNIFIVQEGLAGDAGQCKILVFAYTDRNKAAVAFAHGTGILLESKRFTHQHLTNNILTAVDRNNEVIHCLLSGQYVVTAIGRDQQTTQKVSLNLVRKLAQEKPISNLTAPSH